MAYKQHFETLTEDDFVRFWCIYLVSLAHEQFVKQPRFGEYLVNCQAEIKSFRQSCAKTRIPDIKAHQSLKGIIGWVLSVLKTWRPKLKYKPPFENAGEYELDLFGDPVNATSGEESAD